MTPTQNDKKMAPHEGRIITCHDCGAKIFLTPAQLDFLRIDDSVMECSSSENYCSWHKDLEKKMADKKMATTEEIAHALAYSFDFSKNDDIHKEVIKQCIIKALDTERKRTKEAVLEAIKDWDDLKAKLSEAQKRVDELERYTGERMRQKAIEENTELKSQLATMKEENKILSTQYKCCCKDRTRKDLIIVKQEQTILRMRELIDGCYPVVECWAVISAAQRDWKIRWLKEAKEALKETP